MGARKRICNLCNEKEKNHNDDHKKCHVVGFDLKY